MIIYNERLVKFQGYKEGTFYVLRDADIKQFIKTKYEDLEKVFEYRKNTKDVFLFEKRLREGCYYVLRKNDFFKIKKIADTLDNSNRYSDVMKLIKNYNFVSNIDFVYINTIYFLGNYFQERFIQTNDINIPISAEIENTYLDEYISVTPFFKVFNTIKYYHYKEKYYVYCSISNGKVKHELLFDIDTMKDLFRKYQHPDYEPFDEQEIKRAESLKVRDEEETKEEVNIKEEFAAVANLAASLGTVSKTKPVTIEESPIIEESNPLDDFDSLIPDDLEDIGEEDSGNNDGSFGIDTALLV